MDIWSPMLSDFLGVISEMPLHGVGWKISMQKEISGHPGQQDYNTNLQFFIVLAHRKMILACSRKLRLPHHPRKLKLSLPLPHSQASQNQGEDCSVMKMRKKGEGCLALLLLSRSQKLK